MKVGVIGGGAAGLAAAKNLTEPNSGFECVVFEQTAQIGGTWVYTDEVGTDKYGLPVHTSMYKNLRTNLPKEIMSYPDFPISEEEDISFVPAKVILDYLNIYADKYNLKKYIKFSHQVKTVQPIGNKWRIVARNLPKNADEVYEFDAVMVCNGHYNTPWYPSLEGVKSFPGRTLHSHDYREPSSFKDQRVVIVGAGPSGIDLCLDIATTAKHVILSRHANMEISSPLPSNVEQRLEIKVVSGSNITFVDDSTYTADIIFYCTGYKYNFPFLAPECGITVEDNCVKPLYKHLIHIHKPTLCLIGLPFYVCHFYLFDLQAKFFLKTLKGEVVLPKVDEMLKDLKKEIELREEKGLKRRQFHMMGPLQDDYYRELSGLGNLPQIPPVMARLHTAASQRQLEDLAHFREDVYRLVDREDFIRVK